MKSNIHPAVHPVVFVDTSCGAEFITTSTLTAEETRLIDGVKHFICRIEISSSSHPFYTGKQILVDTARRVEKYQEKVAQRATASATRQGKKVKRAKASAKRESAKKGATQAQATDETK
ncbi:MAG: 50S ribosomal protein L31 [Candidatus Magasanikbacteria bacterium]|nr:50S ribosomal protein L31 [Candidatus Magasanikbacteria bacterium]